MRRLWYHGKVDTMVPGHPRQQALGMEDGTIVFVGSDRDALALPWDEKTDLEGRQVLPGFTDTHMHLLLYALFRDSLPLVGVPSIEAMIERGKAKLAGTGGLLPAGHGLEPGDPGRGAYAHPGRSGPDFPGNPHLSAAHLRPCSRLQHSHAGASENPPRGGGLGPGEGGL